MYVKTMASVLHIHLDMVMVGTADLRTNSSHKQSQ